MMSRDRFLTAAVVVILGGLLAFIAWELFRPVTGTIPTTVPDAPSRRISPAEGARRAGYGGCAAPDSLSSIFPTNSVIIKKADPNVEIVPDPPSTPEEIAAAKAEETERNYSEAISDVVSLYLNHDEKPNAEIAAAFKAEFDKMTPEQRIDHVHEALNLFDDDYLPLIEALALDAKEPAEMLEAVVYDLGNRNEAKVRPIFEKIAAIENHPSRAAAAEWLADRHTVR